MKRNFGRVDLAKEIVVDLIIGLIGNKFVAVTRLMYDRLAKTFIYFGEKRERDSYRNSSGSKMNQ